MRDDIVDEVRRAREEYARQFDFDLEAICRDLQQKQQASGRKVVSFPPRRPEPALSEKNDDCGKDHGNSGQPQQMGIS
jgi:hypothetical protein